MSKNKNTVVPQLTQAWTLSPEATLGSSVRAKGILLEIRARLPLETRKSLDVNGNVLTLSVPESSPAEFRAASAVVSNALIGIESLPVIPREIRDILTITVTERHRWLSDGRLPSAGTRTVRLSGRARRITFHVFDPQMVEDVLDRGVVEAWRQEDEESKAENRRKAAYKAKLTRSLKTGSNITKSAGVTSEDPDLPGWEEFRRDGLLR